MKVTISVTNKDIAEGCSGEASNCPVAKAGNRVLSSSFKCVVFVDFVIVPFGQPSCWDIRLPPKARNFIRDFDHNVPVKPFRFQLDIPAKYLKRKVTP